MHTQLNPLGPQTLLGGGANGEWTTVRTVCTHHPLQGNEQPHEHTAQAQPKDGEDLRGDTTHCGYDGAHTRHTNPTTQLNMPLPCASTVHPTDTSMHAQQLTGEQRKYN